MPNARQVSRTLLALCTASLAAVAGCNSPDMVVGGCNGGRQDNDHDGVCEPACLPTTCDGHGTCDDSSGTPTCTCSGGYEGATCDACATGFQDHDADGHCTRACDATTCSGHGTCSDATGTTVCTCDPGVTGADCSGCAAGQQDRDHDGTCQPACDAATCSGNGTCDDASGTATCTCDTGYSGASCTGCAAGFQDHDGDGTCLPACNSTICGGHGTCDDSSGTPSCGCATGYVGLLCDTCDTGYQDRNGDGTCSASCDATSCTGHGTCDDTTGSIACACSTGYAGATCSDCAAGYQDRDGDGRCTRGCDASTCSMHGTCSDASGTPVCTCDVGVTGTDCSGCAAGFQDRDGDGMCAPSCTTGTCSGNGTCDDTSGLAACTCDTAYTGPACGMCAAGYQDNDGDHVCTPACTVTTCGSHGSCRDDTGSTRCVCLTGYAGALCTQCDVGYQDNDRDGICVPSCGAASCSMHGTCSDLLGSPQCTCDVGYTGATCASCTSGYHDPIGNGVCVPAGTCGDGHRDLGEDCDDSNAITDYCPYGVPSCTVCDATCHNGPGVPTFCGDHVVDLANEECEPGHPACDATCHLACDTGTLGGDDTLLDSAGCYVLFGGFKGGGTATPADAETQCVAMGGHIASIESRGESEPFLAWLNGNDTSTFIGLTGTVGGPHASSWVDGHPVGYVDRDLDACVDESLSTGSAYCTGADASGWCRLPCGYARQVVCELETCGDGVVFGNEECDDGNFVDGDGCDANCTRPRCGNWQIDVGESCDDGNTADGDRCPHDCVLPCAAGSDADRVTLNSYGCWFGYDGSVSWSAGESECVAAGGHLARIDSRTESRLLSAFAGASSHWMGLTDSASEGAWTDAVGTPATVLPWSPGEPNGGTSENCGELFSDGTTNDLYCFSGRPVVCEIATCGNSATDPNEECDDANLVEGDGCDSNCRRTACGNGILTAGEQCDDGNVVDGDGCEHDCTLACGAAIGASAAVRSGGTCYAIVTTAVSFAAAETACMGGGGHLASIPSAAVDTAITTAAGTAVWFGYSDVAVEGTWVWTDGSTSTYTNWHAGEPNDSGGEDCAMLYTDGTWNDAGCAATLPYVCELP